MPGPVDPRQENQGFRPGQPRGNNWLWISLVIAAVIIVVLSAVVISQLRDDKPDASTSASSSQSPTAQAAPQPTSTQPQPSANASPSMTCEGFTANVDEGSQPGWHATINHYGLAYAVPPDWTVAACGVRMGWAKPCPEGQCVIREFGAASTVANPACPKQNLAMAGVTGSKSPDIKAALDEEMKTVPLIYSQNGQEPTVQYTPVREFNIGTHPAVQTVGDRRQHSDGLLHRLIGAAQHRGDHGAECRRIRRLPHLVEAGRNRHAQTRRDQQDR